MIEDKSLKMIKCQYIKTSTNKIEANLPCIIEPKIMKMKNVYDNAHPNAKSLTLAPKRGDL